MLSWVWEGGRKNKWEDFHLKLWSWIFSIKIKAGNSVQKIENFNSVIIYIEDILVSRLSTAKPRWKEQACMT